MAECFLKKSFFDRCLFEMCNEQSRKSDTVL